MPSLGGDGYFYSIIKVPKFIFFGNFNWDEFAMFLLRYGGKLLMCNCNESSMGQMSNEKTLADAAREGLRREDVVAHMC